MLRLSSGVRDVGIGTRMSSDAESKEMAATSIVQSEASSQSAAVYADCEPADSQQEDREPEPAAQHSAGDENQVVAATSGSDGGSFDCNICLELAQDPVVTLCGHLFCWPCLYRWLQVHSISQECPVCKGNVEEEKVIPLYGRGKVGSVDPRTKAVLGISIPHRPSGQRPDMARHVADQALHYAPHGFNYMSGPGGPTATARFGNITLSAGFGLFPSLFGFHLHGLPDGGGVQSIHGGRYSPPPLTPDQQQEAQLSRILLLLGCLVILCLLFF